MTKFLRGAMVLATLSCVIPTILTATSASAGLFDFGRRCQHCQRPACNCHAQQPTVETQLIPQQTIVMRNQVVTQYRQEAYTQNVPVTTYRDVTVDEGGYQMVYVPKPVTKKVAQTAYQQQTAFRTVPYQVTQQVPQVVTQMVPQQISPQQPYSFASAQTGPIIPGAQAAAPTYSQIAVGCAPIVTTCGPCGTVAYAPAIIAPTMSQPIITAPTIAAPVAPNPVTMLPPTTATAHTPNNQPEIDPSAGPVPDPKFLESPGAVKESWTTVGSRHGGQNTVDASRTASSANSKIRFKPAGTLYRLWESQSRIAAGEGPARN